MANEKLEWQNKKDEKMKWNLELHVDQITFDPPQKGWRNSLKQCQEGQKVLGSLVSLSSPLTNHVPSPILQEKKTTRVYCPTRALFYHLKLQRKKEKISLFRIQISEARHPPEGLTVSMTSEKPENHENVVDEYTRKEERTILDKYRRSHLHSPAKQIECPLSSLPTYCCSSMQQL